MSKIIAELPIKTVSEANSSEHWTEKSKRHKSQQFIIRHFVNTQIKALSFPCKVTLTRLSMRFLDEGDNLPMAFKWIKDELSESLLAGSENNPKSYRNKHGKLISIKGRHDSDERIKWRYGQEKAKIQGIRIEIEYG